MAILPLDRFVGLLLGVRQLEARVAQLEGQLRDARADVRAASHWTTDVGHGAG